jgi:preprotein translocase subunit YajC
MTLHFASLLLLAGGSPDGGGSPLFPILIQFGAIFAIFYLLLIRPQQKQRRAHEETIRKVRKGDEVVTAGGIVGEILHVREGQKEGQPVPTMEDRITIKSGESRLVIERGRIARVVPRTAEPAAS